MHLCNANSHCKCPGSFSRCSGRIQEGGRIFRGVKVICVKRIICGRDDFFCSSASTETELEALEVG